MKICLKNAVPVGETTGLRAIRERVLEKNFIGTDHKGGITKENICPAYYGYFASFAKLKALGDKKLKIAIDTANSMGVYELPIYSQFGQNLSIVNLYNDLSHPFECHEANPLKTETLDELRVKVKETGADLGIAYDGDADRIGFVDETGALVPMEITTALIAKPILETHPGATILYDLRSSRAVKEIIEENGGRALECRVGHAFIKRQMTEEQAVFGGELSGHYYFAENYNAEASTLAAIMIMNLMAETGKKASELVAVVKRYHHSGEINSEVGDKDAILAALKEKYSDGRQHELDGLKVEYPNWWFNVRPSNTEPLLRLNLEAETLELMEEKREDLLKLIRGE